MTERDPDAPSASRHPAGPADPADLPGGVDAALGDADARELAASALVDGEADPGVADPEVLALAEDIRSVIAAVQAPVTVSDASRTSAIAAALAVFDEQATPTRVGDDAAGTPAAPVVPIGVATGRRPSARRSARGRAAAGIVGIAAAAAAIGGISRLATGGAVDDAAGGASAPTAMAQEEVFGTAEAKVEGGADASASADDAAGGASESTIAASGESAIMSAAPAAGTGRAAQALDLGPVADEAALQEAAAPYTSAPPSPALPSACGPEPLADVAPAGLVARGTAAVEWRGMPATLVFAAPAPTGEVTVLVVLDDACGVVGSAPVR